MSKVFIHLVLNTVDTEGVNTVLQTVVNEEVEEQVDAATSMSAKILSIIANKDKFLTFPVENGLASVKGSTIEWFQVINVAEMKEEKIEKDKSYTVLPPRRIFEE